MESNRYVAWWVKKEEEQSPYRLRFSSDGKTEAKTETDGSRVGRTRKTVAASSRSHQEYVSKTIRILAKMDVFEEEMWYYGVRNKLFGGNLL